MDIENCQICKKHNENIGMVFQNDLLYVSHYVPHPNRNDNYMGYYFIETKRHFKGLYDATDEEMHAIGIMQKNLSKALKTVSNIEHVYSFIIGEGIDHFHIHIVGRYKDTPRQYYGPQVDDWPEAPRGCMNDISILNQQIKCELSMMYGFL